MTVRRETRTKRAENPVAGKHTPYTISSGKMRPCNEKPVIKHACISKRLKVRGSCLEHCHTHPVLKAGFEGQINLTDHLVARSNSHLLAKIPFRPRSAPLVKLQASRPVRELAVRVRLERLDGFDWPGVAVEPRGEHLWLFSILRPGDWDGGCPPRRGDSHRHWRHLALHPWPSSSSELILVVAPRKGWNLGQLESKEAGGVGAFLVRLGKVW